MTVGHQQARVELVTARRHEPIVVVVIVVSARRRCRLGIVFFNFQRLEHVTEDGAEENDSSDDQQRSLPLVLVDQIIGERREDDRAKAGAANRNSSRQRAKLLKVHRDADDGRKVNHSEAESGAEADGDVKCEDVLGEAAENETN